MDHGDRVGNVMAIMMMNQASDRDERREEREERRQEFRIQMEMQRQQMQQQQNMMAMIMMAMLGRNDGSLSLPNNGIIQNVTVAGENVTGESVQQQQHNEGYGESATNGEA